MLDSKLPEVAIITSGYMPVPNVLGGAVEALDMMLVKENEKSQDYSFTVFSNWTPEAERVAQQEKLQYTKFKFIKIPRFIQAIDHCIFAVAKHFLRKKKLQSYRYIAQRLWYIRKVAKALAKESTTGKTAYDKVIIENHATLFMTMKKHGNANRYQGKVYYHLHNAVTNSFGCDTELTQVHKVLGVSRYCANTLNHYLIDSGIQGIPSEQIQVVKNGIDDTSFGTQQALEEGFQLREKYGIPQNDLVYLFSGRLTAEKGALELLHAFKETHKQNPHTYLVIVGAFFYNAKISSPFEDQLHKLAEDPNVNSHIIFTGFIPYKQMPRFYGMADICVLPSIWDDPAPLAVIEGIVSGKPIITTYSGGIPEYVDNECAIILQRDDQLPDNLAKAMLELSLDSKRRENMSVHSRELAPNFTSQAYARNLNLALKD